MTRSRRRRLLPRLRRVAKVCAALLVLLVLVLAQRGLLHDPAQYFGRLGADVDAQHQFLERRLFGGGPLPMRTLLTHSFYGQSLVDAVLTEPDDAARRAEAVRILRRLLDQIDDEALRSRYASTEVPHGIYYFGQRNLLLAGLLLVDPAPEDAHVRAFDTASRLLFEAFEAEPTAHLASYPGHVWPADNIVALYSLALHDRLYGSGYGTAVDRWRVAIESVLDPETGLMPTKLDPATGAATVPPRGVTLGFSIAYLADLAPDLARTQYSAFGEHHLESRLGLTTVREYRRGHPGPRDVDSGPIVFGVGMGASGFALAASKAMDDRATFGDMVRSAECFGMPFTAPFGGRGGKRYLLGLAPITDAMIVWGKTRVPWLDAASDAARRRPLATRPRRSASPPESADAAPADG